MNSEVAFLKKILCMVLVSVILMSFTACGRNYLSSVDSEDERIINTAISRIEDDWRALGKKHGCPTKIKIANTKIVWIEENDIELFADVKCIVEFDIHSNYFNEDEEYLANYGIFDSVVFYKNGKKEVRFNSLINEYRTIYYSTDYPIERVVDYGSAFDREISL